MHHHISNALRVGGSGLTQCARGEWHAIGISYGSAGQWIMLDGRVVAASPAFTQVLGGAIINNPWTSRPLVRLSRTIGIIIAMKADSMELWLALGYQGSRKTGPSR